jgi:hypothetical protein
VAFAEVVGELEGAQGSIVSSNVSAASTCTANVKVWPVVTPGGQLRVVLINKDGLQGCDVRVQAAGAYQAAVVHRLTSTHPLSMNGKAAGVKWRGLTYEGRPDGRTIGTEASEAAPVAELAGGVGSEWSVALPPASVALLTASPV